MPVQVPAEPKKFTAVYDNFKGVDYTSDPSNVYRRRSPSGTNMLPDLDGRPHKRTGWGIKFSAEDFNTVAGKAPGTTVVPGKTHHFSYGSNDYLMIFNSNGVFFTSSGDETLHLARLAIGTPDSYTVNSFPPQVVGGSNLPADEKRAFFFEGNGVAGFYVFVGNKLFRFGEAETEDPTYGKMFFWEVEPRIPRFLIGCNANGVGTAYEPINMLTTRRTIEYFGDGVSTEYILPSRPEAATVKVEILNQSGSWSNIEKTDPNYPWALDDIKIVFTGGSSKIPKKSEVGNLRVTYTPDGASSGYELKYNIKTNSSTLTDTISATYRRTKSTSVVQVWDSARKKWVNAGSSSEDPATAWKKVATSRTANVSATLNTPNNYDKSELVVKANYSGSYQTVSPTLTWGAYSSSVKVTFPNNVAAKTAAIKTATSAWRKTSSKVIWTSSAGFASYREIVTYWEQTKTETQTKTFGVYGLYTKYEVTSTGEDPQKAKDAFAECSKVLTFGNNIYNQVFVSACPKKDYRNRLWYSGANDPTYFPDTNYIEVGADDKTVMGLIRVGQYLGVVKRGSGTDASVYLAYPTSFEEQTTYAVKQSVSGIGAISSGAFNILNEEPLFLSERGVMGVDLSESNPDKQIRNRSHYINKRLLSESELGNAISYVFDGMYYLAVNDRCYVLDGAQKTSWANEKTNLQYECYYLENVPAQCFAEMDNVLYFTDYKGNLCYFKRSDENLAYADAYGTASDWISARPPVNGKIIATNISGSDLAEWVLIDNEDDYLVDAADDHGYLVYAGTVKAGDVIRYNDNYYTVTALEEEEGVLMATVSDGVAVPAEWATVADDDDMVHFFKNLTKKGCVVSLLPEGSTAVDIYLRADEKDPVYFGRMLATGTFLPSDIFVKKKIKKYKRLQIICKNNEYNESFALDQIIKTYTVGNYSKNRG